MSPEDEERKPRRSRASKRSKAGESDAAKRPDARQRFAAAGKAAPRSKQTSKRSTASKQGATSRASETKKGATAKRTTSPRSAGAARRRPTSGFGRLRTGEAIYLGAAVLLFVLMFFDWFGAKATSAAEGAGGLVTGSAGGSAWDTLEVIPLFLMLAIVVAVGAAILRLSKSNWKPAIPPSAAVCVLGLLASLLILIRIISPPGPDGALSELAYDTTRRLPVFLALAAALGIAYGGRRAMDEEGTGFGGIAQRLESPGRPERPRPATDRKRAAREKS